VPQRVARHRGLHVTEVRPRIMIESVLIDFIRLMREDWEEEEGVQGF